VLCLAISTTALAWHDSGHRKTAQIAFAVMTPAQQAHVIRILRAHPRFQEDFLAEMPDDVSNSSEARRNEWLFSQAATWSDLVRDRENPERQFFNRSRWHYINLPVYLTERDRELLDGNLEHNMSTTFEPPLRQNLNSIQALRGNLAVWHDADANDSDKAVALCWILHLTGDIHQPLHNVALFSSAYFPEGDRGGNSIAVLWGDDIRNLHSVWDGLPSAMQNVDPSEATVMSIRSDVVDDASIDEWLRHHTWLGEKFVYSDDVLEQLRAGLANSTLPAIELSRDYLVIANAIARRQINLAGHRIAALLE